MAACSRRPQAGSTAEAGANVAPEAHQVAAADAAGLPIDAGREALALLARLDCRCLLPQCPPPLGHAAVNLGLRLGFRRVCRRL